MVSKAGEQIHPRSDDINDDNDNVNGDNDDNYDFIDDGSYDNDERRKWRQW